MRHGTTLLVSARKFCVRTIDADDVYQRTAEMLLLKAPQTEDEDHLLAWALTVLRNEAVSTHRRSSKAVSYPPEKLAEIGESTTPQPDELAVSAERIRFGREALSRIKPEQMRCMLLRAEGLGYDQISARTGYSYTMVNRYLSEGRAAFRDRVDRIESGAECRRLAGVLSMMADGVATADSTADARRHIDNCLACQATLREYRSVPARVAAFAPLAVLLPAVSNGGTGRVGAIARQASDALQSLLASTQERMAAFSGAAGSGAELAFAKKAVIVTAVSASLVAGGAAVEYVASPDAKPDIEQPTGATGVSPPVAPVAAPVPGAGGAAKVDSDRHSPREARESDVIGDKSVTHVPDVETPSIPRGDSADGPDSHAAPLPSQPGSGGSSNQSSDLAP